MLSKRIVKHGRPLFKLVNRMYIIAQSSILVGARSVIGRIGVSIKKQSYMR